MDIPSLQDIQKQRQQLSDKPLKDHRGVLEGLGNYFQRTRPSAIDDKYILEVEGLLNEVYLQAIDEGWSSDLEEHALEALSMNAELSRAINSNSGGEHDKDFFKTIKRLGKTLLLFSKQLARK